jgi:guanine deaminase
VALHTETTPQTVAHRGAILYFIGDPGPQADPRSVVFIEDGILLVENGLVAQVGPATQLLPALPASVAVVEHVNGILMPGFIDTHIHYPQTDVIGCGGRNLLEWLENHTYPAERRFSDFAYARETAAIFLDELARNGTTTALVFCTVHRASVEAFFQTAARRGMRMIAGKVLMDRNCPEYLRDTPATGEQESRELLEKWHGHDRLQYAITPRFAATSSPAQLESAGRLATDFPDACIQSHVAETRDEVDWVKRLFPDARSYLNVYDSYGLVRERSVYAHCIYLDRTDRTRMAQLGAGAAFCPSSNLYLGSGLFDIAATDSDGLRFSIATDVGGGNSFSMLRTMGDAYKVAQLSGQTLSPQRAFYLATLGAARILGLEDRVGCFKVGSEADFIVLDLEASPLIARRTAQSRTLAEKLLVLMTLGDDRAIRRTYVLGRQVHTTQSRFPSHLDTRA